MLSKLFAAITSVVVMGAAHSQTTIPLPLKCFPPEQVEKLIKQYKESPYFVGVDTSHKMDNLVTGVHLNRETGSYTMFLYVNEQNVVCVVSVGEKGRILYQQ